MGERDLVIERVEKLLAAHPPATTEPAVFWGAQYDAGLAWVQFPEGLGGLGVDRDLQHLVNDRLDAAGASRPDAINLIGVSMTGPTLFEHGTPEQRARYLRPAFTCEERWCQLFSEPEAGSDLASLRTKAVLDGDSWVVTGQKVWTTMAHKADLGLLMARTEPDQPKHAGITYFIADMHAPGVEVRPLRQITGDAEYNEVFLDEVRIPDSQRIGPRGAGWRVAMSTLMNERTGLSAMIGSSRGDGLIGPALAAWADVPVDARTAVDRDRLARLWIGADVLRLTFERAEQAQRHGLPQGRQVKLPSVPGPAGSIIKLAFGALGREVSEFCVDVAGPAGLLVDHYDMIQPELFTLPGEQDLGNAAKALLMSQSLTIAGGTTNINRNILAERVLGLPPEPRPHS
jgi:alkylation response protein AidB-like acyl-CoA dehydrogenase